MIAMTTTPPTTAPATMPPMGVEEPDEPVELAEGGSAEDVV